MGSTGVRLPPLLLLLVLLVDMANMRRGSLVKVNRGLKVKRGQEAFLQEEDLRFHVLQERDTCKVEVVLNEPITQRVGSLTPQVFDCHFLTDEVKYVHNGCPILKEDRIMLRLYRFTEMETYTEIFFLHVEIQEPDCNIIHLGPRTLEVPEFYSVSDKLNGNVLSFHYERRHNLECNVRIATHDTHLPAHGHLVTGEPEKLEPRGDEPHSFILLQQQLMNKARAKCKEAACLKGMKLVQTLKVPCEDFLLMGLRYQHTNPPSPDVDYIAIRVDLTDTRSRSIYRSERAWIPVRIKNAIPNQPPKLAFMSTFILEVDQFILTPFSTAVIDAEDGETPKSLLVFNISKPPQEGFITHLSDHTKPITSFLWEDLNDMQIAYQPPNCSHTQRRNYEVEFEVHDFYFVKSTPVVVHISVRTADTNAPRVSWNMGLSLLEGQSRPITWDQLQIADNNNLKSVRIIVVDGLQHGRLTVRGGKGFMFTVNDIKAGVVRYHHDDSDTTKDFVVFRITDGSHQTRHKFPITILPKDDSPPFLITNTVLELEEGNTALLRGSVLQASDMDSSDDYILFNITRSPQDGEIMKIPGPGITGYPVTRFLQRDLFHSIIYYRHLGNEVFEDSFEVVLSDFHDPPNLSEPQVIVVHITPVHDQLPKEAPGVTRQLIVKETDVVHLTKKQLHFIDLESPDSELTYTVTSPPFYISSHGKSDAGRLFLVDSIPKFAKDPSAPILRLFTQQAVNYMKVAYMPPIEDIGIHPQHIQFVLSVTNQQGGTLVGICFNITVLPVDNQAPQVHTSPLAVEEGGDCPLDLDHLRVTDPDSPKNALWVELKVEPQHGHLYLDGSAIRPGQTFTLQDMNGQTVRYHHDGSETDQDDIVFMATDGINTSDFILHVEVALVNDEVPVIMPGLKPTLDCAEGQEVVITTEYLQATDKDSDDSELIYMIARQPYYGVVCKNGIVVDRFVQADVVTGSITYKHTGQEIGLTPRYDIITFVISDEEAVNLPACTSSGGPAAHLQKAVPVYDLNVTVFPVDSQAPSLVIGELFVVDEGGFASITTAHLIASDVDTPVGELGLILVSPPQFGYIENILPSPGFEKSNMGISIGSFTYRDVKSSYINYVQSRHQRLEPTADQFMIRVSDGKRSSPDTPFYIIISPTNDEVPDFLARNITVSEGQMRELDPSILDAVDLDVPRDHMVFSIIESPKHGAIMGKPHVNDVNHPRTLRPGNPNTGVEMKDFTLDELRNGVTVMYVHDDSESLHDSFTIQVSDGKHRLQKRVEVTVLPVNDEAPRVTRNMGIEVEMGESRLISGAVLSAQDEDTHLQNVLYVFESIPTQGLLQIKVGLDWVTLGKGANCSQETVDANLFRYLHTGSTGPQEATGLQNQDFFVFHVEDGANRSPTQNFQVTLKTMEKGDIAVFSKPVLVTRGGRVVLTTDILLAVDGTDHPEELLYVVMEGPAHGHMEYAHHPGTPITSFSQMDVAANLVCYVHSKWATSPREMLWFMISNGHSSRNGTLEIAVETADRELPSLQHNGGLWVPQGSTTVLSPDVLTLSDPDTPPDSLLFLLVQPPHYGELLLKGAPLYRGNFTQQHLLDLDVAYRHAGSSAQIDRFSFIASDGTNQGFLLEGKLQTQPVFFTIQVEPLDSPAPQIIQLQAAWRAELLKDGRYGIFVSSRELRAREAGGRNENITFQIIRGPSFGHLENASTGQFIRHGFTQRDLSRRIVLYVISLESEALSDSLQFQVLSPLRNHSLPHILEFHWASVEFSQTKFSVCEEEGRLSLTVLRRGNCAESSYVTVKVKEITASSGADFIPSPASLIQFDPGVSFRTWWVEITEDQLEEAEEIFTVSLVSPKGVVLGHRDNALVTILDSGTGQCRTGRRVQQVPPYHGAIQLETLPFVRGDALPVVQQETPFSHRRLRPVGNGRTVQASVVQRNGSNVVFTYHGMVSLRVQDDSSPSQLARLSQVRVTGRGKERPASASDRASHWIPRACGPGDTDLLHYNRSSGQIWHCNGVSWKPWTPRDQQQDKCPQGWTFHRERCYVLSKGRRVTWSGAVRACREIYRGTLVSIRSKSDMGWLWDFGGQRPFWIGLNDRENRGRWEWVGGEPVTYTNWRGRSPRVKRKGGTRRCVLVQQRAKWNMRDCERGKEHRFVCHTRT
ncbi:FRAS1-related extracellular matrix protein 1a isoform X3 [Scleropages formosus]|uniref:FRAS1-related extracellular matrix protein 1a isoform X3 n=1 Tax=Scleropages formosus TaxID=113540 RepID=UPI0010FAA267|nr:FRAS1-related extracellular matrix protein 1 isoform X3 [Scleropages formosus]